MKLEVRRLSKEFRFRSGFIGKSTVLHAVNDVSFTVPESGTLAIVGETGSGKTTVARMIMGLETPTSGDIVTDESVLSLRPNLKERRRRARMMQMVFQNPIASLDPHQAIDAAIAEIVSFHGLATSANRGDRLLELLSAVGLDERLSRKRPQQLSGGQCQRVAIARALAAEPQLLVLDEPVSALDVSTQAQILNLLTDLKVQFGLSLLIISHDLALVMQLADDVVVMQNGEVVECGAVEAVLSHPQHEYTRRLIASAPERMSHL
jgi:ABC-type glutathione transport system ATPase component